MPLVEYVGNASPQDNTEVVLLNPGPNGEPRSIARGKRALLSGSELRSLAAGHQVRVIEDTDETDLEAIPSQMPSGYNEDGYKEGEAVDYDYGPGADEGDAEASSTPAPSSPAPAPVSPAPSPSGPSPSPSPAPTSPPAPSPSSSAGES
jgi:hypothetical protein